MSNYSQYDFFMANRKSLADTFENAIEKAMDKMGSDLKCVEWFCSIADNHISEKTQKAA